MHISFELVLSRSLLKYKDTPQRLHTHRYTSNKHITHTQTLRGNPGLLPQEVLLRQQQHDLQLRQQELIARREALALQRQQLRAPVMMQSQPLQVFSRVCDGVQLNRVE